MRIQVSVCRPSGTDWVVLEWFPLRAVGCGLGQTWSRVSRAWGEADGLADCAGVVSA